MHKCWINKRGNVQVMLWLTPTLITYSPLPPFLTELAFCAFGLETERIFWIFFHLCWERVVSRRWAQQILTFFFFSNHNLLSLWNEDILASHSFLFKSQYSWQLLGEFVLFLLHFQDLQTCQYTTRVNTKCDQGKNYFNIWHKEDNRHCRLPVAK